MKTLALTLILGLHATGLWSQVAPATQAKLISRAADTVPAVATPPAALATPATAALPVRLATDPLTLNTAAAIAIDRDTATVLYAKDSTARRPIASITKLITSLVILSRHDPSETVTIPKLPDYPVEAETMGLVPGDTFRLSELLEAALVPSANDAADAMAIWDSGSVAKFTTVVNASLAEWGIADTHFASASGLEDDGNYASAAALAKIAALALHSPDIAKIVNFQSITLVSGQNRTYKLTTTNQLLASGRFYGIKTGYTLAAGECFVGLTRINGHDVITVVLGADNRFGATSQLTNWISRQWEWL